MASELAMGLARVLPDRLEAGLREFFRANGLPGWSQASDSLTVSNQARDTVDIDEDPYFDSSYMEGRWEGNATLKLDIFETAKLFEDWLKNGEPDDFQLSCMRLWIGDVSETVGRIEGFVPSVLKKLREDGFSEGTEIVLEELVKGKDIPICAADDDRVADFAKETLRIMHAGYDEIYDFLCNSEFPEFEIGFTAGQHDGPEGRVTGGWLFMDENGFEQKRVFDMSPWDFGGPGFAAKLSDALKEGKEAESQRRRPRP